MAFWDNDPFGGRLPAEPGWNPTQGGGAWPASPGGGGPGPTPGPGASQFGGFNLFPQARSVPGYDPRGAGMRRRRRAGSTGMWNAAGGEGGIMGSAPPLQTSQTAPRGEFEAISDPTERRSNYWNAIMSDFGSGNASNLTAEALANMILGGKGQGAFGPEGDPRVMQTLMDDANRQGLAFENSAVLGADLDGGDFWNRGMARTGARLNAQRMRGDLANQVRTTQAKQYADLLNQLLMGKLSGGLTMDDDFTRDRWAANREGANRPNPFMNLLGQATGAAVGAYTGGGKGGASASGSNFPRYDYMGSGRTY